MLIQRAASLVLTSKCYEFSARFTSESLEEEFSKLLGPTLPSEIVGAVEGRRNEFFAGRLAASYALSLAGHTSPYLVGSKEDGAPIWPEGFVGSITHVRDYVSAAAARKDRVKGIGRDSAEVMSLELASSLKALILRPKEMVLMSESLLAPEVFTTVAFSAKESLFKALPETEQGSFDPLEYNVIIMDLKERVLTLTKGSEEFSIRYELENSSLIHTGCVIQA